MRGGRGLGGMLHPAWGEGRNWLRRANSSLPLDFLGAAPRRDSMPLGFDPPTALRSRAFFVKCKDSSLQSLPRAKTLTRRRSSGRVSAMNQRHN